MSYHSLKYCEETSGLPKHLFSQKRNVSRQQQSVSFCSSTGGNAKLKMAKAVIKFSYLEGRSTAVLSPSYNDVRTVFRHS